MPVDPKFQNLVAMKSVHSLREPNFVCVSTSVKKRDAIFSQNLSKIIVKTFQPELSMVDIVVKHKDGNYLNDAFDNLEVRITSLIPCADEEMKRFRMLAPIEGEEWVPVVTWDGCIIQNYFVSNKGRFYFEFADGRKHHLNMGRSQRVRIRRKQMNPIQLIVRAFIITEPQFGYDQYYVTKVVDDVSNISVDNLIVYFGSLKLQNFLSA
jgi:hypothetical protein